MKSGPIKDSCMSSPPSPPSKPFTTDKERLKQEVVVQTFRASGPGGQHRNVTDSGVRMIHPPSGVTVSATESRSQFRNRARALERLVARLEALNRVKKPRIATKKSRAAKERVLREKHRTHAKKRLRQPPAPGEGE